MNALRRTAVGGLVAVLLTAGGQPAASGESAVTTKLIEGRTTAALNLPAPGLVRVRAITVPEGSWTVIARVVATHTGSSDFVRCSINDVTTTSVLDASTVAIGSGFPSDTITLLSPLTVSPGTSDTVHLKCGHDGVSGNGASIDAGASVMAFATAASAQYYARTATSFALPAASPMSPVASLDLPRGVWVLGFKVTAVSFDATGLIAQCALTTSNGRVSQRVVTAGTGRHSASTLFGVDYVFTTGARHVSLRCRNARGDGGGGYLDPGSVIWARQVRTLAAVPGCGSVNNGSADALVTRADQAPCAVPVDSEETFLGGMQVTNGTWAVLGTTNISADGPSGTACEMADLSDGPTLDGVRSWSDVTDSGTRTGSTFLRSIKTTVPVTVGFGCSTDSTSDALDTGAYVAIKL